MFNFIIYYQRCCVMKDVVIYCLKYVNEQSSEKGMNANGTNEQSHNLVLKHITYSYTDLVLCCPSSSYRGYKLCWLCNLWLLWSHKIFSTFPSETIRVVSVKMKHMLFILVPLFPNNAKWHTQILIAIMGPCSQSCLWAGLSHVKLWKTPNKFSMSSKMKRSFEWRIYSRGDAHETELMEIEKTCFYPDTQHETFKKRKVSLCFLPCQTVSWVVQNLCPSACVCEQVCFCSCWERALAVL